MRKPWIAAGICLAVAACGGEGPPDGGQAPGETVPVDALAADAPAGHPDPDPTPPTDPAHVLLISIDTLRADALKAYGHDRETAPTLTALAGQGAVFEHAVSAANWTLPSHATMLTGLLPASHRVETSNDRLNPARATLAQELAAKGYRTAGFVSNPFLDARYGYARGFERYEQPRDFTFEKAGQAAGSIAGFRTRQPRLREADYFVDVTSPAILDLALDFLDAQDDAAPFFLFVHFNDVHSDYIPPEPYDWMFAPDYEGTLLLEGYPHNKTVHAGLPPADLAWLRAQYDGEIRWVDEHLGRLLARLAERGLAEDTLVIVTADHGEGFFERGGHKEHHYGAYDELVHVPLLLRFPGRIAAGTRIPQLISQADIAPTVLGLLGAQGLPDSDGLDWSLTLRGGAPPAASAKRPVISQSVLYPEKGENASLVFAVRTDTHTAHARRKRTGRATTFQVFDRRTDPDELHPLPADHPDWRGMINLLIAEQAAAEARAAALPMATSDDALPDDEDLLEQMRRLGYLERGDLPEGG